MIFTRHGPGVKDNHGGRVLFYAAQMIKSGKLQISVRNQAVISHSIVKNTELITPIRNLNSSAKMDFVFVATTHLLPTHLRFNG